MKLDSDEQPFACLHVPVDLSFSGSTDDERALRAFSVCLYSTHAMAVECIKSGLNGPGLRCTSTHIVRSVQNNLSGTR